MKEKSPSFLKIVYFDEAAAQDYLDIFGEGVHMALNKALEICKSYGFETKNCF